MTWNIIEGIELIKSTNMLKTASIPWYSCGRQGIKVIGLIIAGINSGGTLCNYRALTNFTISKDTTEFIGPKRRHIFQSYHCELFAH
jgi:hypothetical protein